MHLAGALFSGPIIHISSALIEGKIPFPSDLSCTEIVSDSSCFVLFSFWGILAQLGFWGSLENELICGKNGSGS